MPTFSDRFTPINENGYEEMAITDAVQSLNVPGLANAARVQVFNAGAVFTEESQIVRFNMSPNIPPTHDLGNILGHLDFIELSNVSQLKSFKFISAEAGVSGKLLIQYFRG
mgnify:CR=1 FL=1